MIRLKDLLTEQERYAQPFQPERYMRPGIGASGADLVAAAEKAQSERNEILFSPDFFEFSSMFIEVVPIIGPGLASASLLRAAKLRADVGDTFAAAIDTMFAFLPVIGPFMSMAVKPLTSILQRLIANKYSLQILSSTEKQLLKERGIWFARLMKDPATRARCMQYFVDASAKKRGIRIDPKIYDQILKLLTKLTVGNPIVAKKIAKEVAELTVDTVATTAASTSDKKEK